MHLKRYQFSLIILSLFFMLFVSAKHAKKSKKYESPFEKLKKEYITYKHTAEVLKEEKLKEFYIKFNKFYEQGNEKESILAYYFSADVLEKLFDVTGDNDYLDNALKIYKKISQLNHNYSLAAKKKLELYGNSVKSDRDSVKDKEGSKEYKQQILSDKGEKVTIQNVSFTIEENKTKIIVELTSKAFYEHKFLNEDIENRKPKRIVLDIKNASFSEQLGKTIPISSKNVEKIRIGKFTDDIARIVIDLNHFKNYKVYNLTDSFKVVVEVFSEEQDEKKSLDNRENSKVLSLNQNNSNYKLTVKKIVVDMGHGGHDPGAIGINGLREKDVVLDIGLKLGGLIKKNFPEIEVIYTRNDDFYLTLEERTRLANANKADLFVSIHANASKNKHARGIETYFLDFAKEERAKEVAARENATTLQGVDEVQSILRDLIVSSKYNESTLLASLVQKNLINTLSKVNGEVVDLGVKQGPFYVLIGAAMPSILVETSFITHEKEGMLLAKEEYRNYIANGIFEGVKEYVMKTAVAINDGNKKIVTR